MTNKTIYKYHVNMGPFIQALPKGAEVLCAQMQNGNPHIWVLLDPDAEKEERMFTIIGTGEQGAPPKSQYIGTLQDPPFVWHLFEIV